MFSGKNVGHGIGRWGMEAGRGSPSPCLALPSRSPCLAFAEPSPCGRLAFAVADALPSPCLAVAITLPARSPRRHLAMHSRRRSRAVALASVMQVHASICKYMQAEVGTRLK